MDDCLTVEQFDEIDIKLERMLLNGAALMRDAEDDLLAFTGFRQAHRRQLCSTNPLERTGKEIERRRDVGV